MYLRQPFSELGAGRLDDDLAVAREVAVGPQINLVQRVRLDLRKVRRGAGWFRARRADATAATTATAANEKH